MPKKKQSRPTRSEAEAAVRTLIAWLGEDPDREGLVDTPRRVVKAFAEYYDGYNLDADAVLAKTFSETGGYDGPVLVRDIAFESRCEHHMAPFIGKAHIAYIPKGRVLGLSKLARLVDVYAHRMQTQERLTAEIVAALERNLKTGGIAVLVEAEHFCMKVRGVHKTDAVTVTTKFTGEYLKKDAMREDFYRQLRLPAPVSPPPSAKRSPRPKSGSARR